MLHNFSSISSSPASALLPDLSQELSSWTLTRILQCVLASISCKHHAYLHPRAYVRPRPWQSELGLGRRTNEGAGMLRPSKSAWCDRLHGHPRWAHLRRPDDNVQFICFATGTHPQNYVLALQVHSTQYTHHQLCHITPKRHKTQYPQVFAQHCSSTRAASQETANKNRPARELPSRGMAWTA